MVAAARVAVMASTSRSRRMACDCDGFGSIAGSVAELGLISLAAMDELTIFFFELKAGALPDHIRRRRSTKFIHVVIT